MALRREPGLVHTFILLDDVSPACAAAVDRLAGDLRELLAQIAGHSPTPSAGGPSDLAA